jgi:pimeloyl-ACP methyl ester carboxylesterase
MSSDDHRSRHPAPEALAPLAGLQGERPPAPEWFAAALTAEPERSVTQVDGAGIETLVWGRRGAPGLLFLHGNGAHADWWSFIAPLFAADYRVATFSFAGMGRSGWRDHYDTRGAVTEAMGVAQAAGLFEGPRPPVFVGHSFGGVVAASLAARHGAELRAAVIVDPPFASPERALQMRDQLRVLMGRTRHMKMYPTLEAALSRFRLLPLQPAEHLFIVDHIARHSLQEVEGGWTWRFDPQLLAKMTFTDISQDLAAPACPLALMHGERSGIVRQVDLDLLWSLVPADTPRVMIPDADHHVMIDQPLAFVAALRGLLAGWPR